MITLVGLKYVDYVSKKTNKPVKGYNIYVTETDVKDVVGCCCYDVFISPELYDSCFKGINIGDSIELIYNRFGYVSDARKVF